MQYILHSGDINLYGATYCNKLSGFELHDVAKYYLRVNIVLLL